MSRGMLLTLASVFCTSCGVILTRYLLVAGENPLNLTVWVILFTLLPWMFIFSKHTQEFKKLSKKTIALLVFVGIAGSIGVTYLQALALAHTQAVNFSFIYRTVIVFTIIFAWIFFKEKITLAKGILAIVIITGSYLITTNGQGLTLSKGDIYSLLMAASAALISNILVKHTISKMHPDLTGSVMAIVGFCSLFIAANLTNVFAIPSHLPLILVGSVLYFGLIIFRNRAYQISTASFVSMVFGLSPLFVTVLSFFILHETLSPIQLIGGLLIVGSTFFVQRLKI
jgi:drug/metabolite transporter (DMT)-like permease